MKKLFVLILALMSAGILNNASAQCQPPDTTGTGGWSPDWECFDCIQQGTGYANVLNIEIPGAFGSVTLDSIVLDRIEGVPTGITYTIQPSKSIPGGSTACLDIVGTTSDTIGKYKALIYVKLYTSVVDITTPTELGELLRTLSALLPPDFDTTSFDYYLRVIAQGGVCDSTACVALSSNDLSDNLTGLAAQPNPFNSKTQISWNANTAGKFTAKMFDVAGKEVFSKQLDVRTGTNKMMIERGALPAGSYVFILTDGRKSISTKLMVRE